MSLSPVHLNRAQRRKLQKLADKVDRVTESDRRFFERFPHRQYRVRPAGQAEIEALDVMDGNWSPGATPCVAVRNIAPGVRARAFIFTLGPVDTDIGEDDARAIFESVAPPEMRA
jgi:hypothetical protein